MVSRQPPVEDAHVQWDLIGMSHLFQGAAGDPVAAVETADPNPETYGGELPAGTVLNPLGGLTGDSAGQISDPNSKDGRRIQPRTSDPLPLPHRIVHPDGKLVNQQRPGKQGVKSKPGIFESAGSKGQPVNPDGKQVQSGGKQGVNSKPAEAVGDGFPRLRVNPNGKKGNAAAGKTGVQTRDFGQNPDARYPVDPNGKQGAGEGKTSVKSRSFGSDVSSLSSSNGQANANQFQAAPLPNTGSPGEIVAQAADGLESSRDLKFNLTDSESTVSDELTREELELRNSLESADSLEGSLFDREAAATETGSKSVLDEIIHGQMTSDPAGEIMGHELAKNSLGDKHNTQTPGLEPAFTTGGGTTGDARVIGGGDRVAGQPQPMTAVNGNLQVELPQLVDTVTKSTWDAVQNIQMGDSRTVRIQIQPEELGFIDIHVEMTQDAVKAQIVASEQTASELLNRERSSLLNALHELGIETAELEISHGDSFEQANDSSRFGDQTEKHEWDRGWQQPVNGAENRPVSESRPPTRAGDSRVDVVA